jgi:hypothetical protein
MSILDSWTFYNNALRFSLSYNLWVTSCPFLAQVVDYGINKIWDANNTGVGTLYIMHFCFQSQLFGQRLDKYCSEHGRYGSLRNGWNTNGKILECQLVVALCICSLIFQLKDLLQKYCSSSQGQYHFTWSSVWRVTDYVSFWEYKWPHMLSKYIVNACSSVSPSHILPLKPDQSFYMMSILEFCRNGTRIFLT